MNQIYRFIKHCKTDTLTPDTFVMAMIYMKRLSNPQTFYNISSAYVHLAFAASFVVAQKLHTDDYFSNSHYHIVAGTKSLQGT